MRMQSSMSSRLLGEEEMPKGASPIPGTSSMTNCPGFEGKPLPIVLVDDPYAVEVFRVRESRHSGDLGFVGVFIHAKVVLPEVLSLRMLLDVDVFQTGVQIRPPRRERWQ